MFYHCCKSFGWFITLCRVYKASSRFNGSRCLICGFSGRCKTCKTWFHADLLGLSYLYSKCQNKQRSWQICYANNAIKRSCEHNSMNVRSKEFVITIQWMFNTHFFYNFRYKLITSIVCIIRDIYSSTLQYYKRL